MPQHIRRNGPNFPSLVQKGFVMPDGSPIKPKASGWGYEGAAGGRRLGPWQASGFGPNTLIVQNIYTLRDRVRDSIRNNPWMAGAMQTFSSNLIGKGIRPRWILEDKTLQKKIHDAWERWVDECDSDGNTNFYGMQELVAKTIFQSGEQLIRFRSRRLQDTLSVPLQLQALEPDFLSPLNDGILANGNMVRMGIELNQIGQRAAYWLYKSHPGEGNYFFNNNLTTYRIPATQIAHVYRVDRPGQLRGIPWASAALVRMYMFDNYEDAELDRKKTAAMFAGFITSNPEEQGTSVGYDADINSDAVTGKPFTTLEPGILQYLVPGEDIKFAEPADVGTNYEVFIKQQLRAIAMACGLTYEQFTGDLKGVNYSSIRAGTLEARRKMQAIQHNVLVFQFCRRVAQVWLATAVASGKLDLPGFAQDPTVYHRVEWQPDGWQWIDPVKEVNAARQAVLSGFTSRTAVIAGLGRSAETVDDENANDQKRADDLKLKYDIDARGGPVTPAAPTPSPAEKAGAAKPDAPTAGAAAGGSK